MNYKRILFGICLSLLIPCSSWAIQDADLLGILQSKEALEQYKQMQNSGTGGNMGGSIGLPQPQATQPAQPDPETLEPSVIEKSYRGKSLLDIDEKIGQFGYDYFTTNFSNPEYYKSIPVGPDYVLGPGDSLNVYIWGKIQEKFTVRIENDGKVFLPKVGKISLLGLTYEQAQQVIRRNLAQHFANFEVNVTLDELRTITIYAVGEVNKPGSYRISSLGTLFNVLYAAGGPTKRGTLRNVKVIRKNTVVATVDLYDYILTGEKNKQYTLQEGDTLFIPVIGKTVGIAGHVKRPGIYEIRGSETIQDAIAMAGNVTPYGLSGYAQVERVDSSGQKVVLDIRDTTPVRFGSTVRDGDLIKIVPVLPAKRKVVTIEGHIGRPGQYALEQGMRVADLIAKAGGIIPNTHQDRIDLDRLGPDYSYLYDKKKDQNRQPETGNQKPELPVGIPADGPLLGGDNAVSKQKDLSSDPFTLKNHVDSKDKKVHNVMPLDLGLVMQSNPSHNVPLRDGDVVTLYSDKDITPDEYVYIAGHVRSPGAYSMDRNMKLADLIFKAGGIKRGAYYDEIELYRAGSDTDQHIITLNLTEIINDNPRHNLPVRPDDHLVIKEDQEYSNKRIVAIRGEVNYPGNYIIEKNERLSSLIKRAGQYRHNAFLPGAILIRQSLKDNEASMSRKFLKNEEKRLLQKQINLIDEENRDLAALKEQLPGTTDEVEAHGRLIVNLKPLDELEGSEDDIVLEAGDTLYIPSIPSSVQVLGGVYNQSSVIYKKGKSIDYYIDKVGGTTRYADRGEMYVMKANGEVTKDWGYRPERGDTIMVPEEIKKDFDLWEFTLKAVDIVSKIALTLAVLQR